MVSLRASFKECIQLSLLDDLNSASVWKAAPLGLCSEVLLVSIGRRCLCCWRSILVTSRVYYNVMLHNFGKDVRNKSSERGNLKKKPFDILSIWNVGKVGGNDTVEIDEV